MKNCLKCRHWRSQNAFVFVSSKVDGFMETIYTRIKWWKSRRVLKKRKKRHFWDFFSFVYPRFKAEPQNLTTIHIVFFFWSRKNDEEEQMNLPLPQEKNCKRARKYISPCSKNAGINCNIMMEDFRKRVRRMK